MESILLTVKKSLGVAEEEVAFDDELILSINTAFMSLMQIGVGSDTGYSITDSNDMWTDFLGTQTDLEGVKTFICLKVRSYFDPPASSFVLQAIENQLKELEFRLIVQTEPPSA